MQLLAENQQLEMERFKLFEHCEKRGKERFFAGLLQKALNLDADRCKAIADYHAKLAATYLKAAKLIRETPP